MNRKQVIQEFLLMTFGTLLVSVGVYFFKFPNNFSMGGVAGLAVLLGELFPQISASTYNTVINVTETHPENQLTSAGVSSERDTSATSSSADTCTSPAN